jgi:hypothetical protein
MAQMSFSADINRNQRIDIAFHGPVDVQDEKVAFGTSKQIEKTFTLFALFAAEDPQAFWASLSEVLHPQPFCLGRSFPSVRGLAILSLRLASSQPFPLSSSELCYAPHTRSACSAVQKFFSLPATCAEPKHQTSSMLGSMPFIMLSLPVSMVSYQMVPTCATATASQCTVTFTAGGTSQIGPTSTTWGASMTTYLNVSYIEPGSNQCQSRWQAIGSRYCEIDNIPFNPPQKVSLLTLYRRPTRANHFQGPFTPKATSPMMTVAEVGLHAGDHCHHQT